MTFEIDKAIISLLGFAPNALDMRFQKKWGDILEIDVAFTLLDMNLRGSASFEQEFSFTPTVDVTFTTSTGQLLSGKLGEKFEFETPEGEGTIDVSAAYVLSGALTSTTFVRLSSYLDYKLLQGSIYANIPATGTDGGTGFGPLIQGSIILGGGIRLDLFRDTSIYTGPTINENYAVSYEKFVTAASGAYLQLTTNQISVEGGDIDNTIIGNLLDNLLNGNGGHDSMFGGIGADSLNGGEGDDTLEGGDGDDALSGGVGNDVYVLAEGSDIVSDEDGNDTIFSSVTRILAFYETIENLTLVGDQDIDGFGNALDNIIVGNDRGNLLDGAGGVDTLAGGKGNDTYLVDDPADVVVELEGEGVDTVKASVTYLLEGTFVERLTLTGPAAIDGYGNALSNRITGNRKDNKLFGVDGNDTLDGGTGGADSMFGGKGNDVFIVNSADDYVRELNNEGHDRVESSVSYSLAGQNLEDLVLTGRAIDGTGNKLANRITGNDAANRLDGGAGGADTLIGGNGSDRYIVNSTGDRAMEKDGEGRDTVEASVSYSLAGQYLEDLVLVGDADLNGVGNKLNNLITGNSGNNKLDGGSGGADTMKGGDGDDTYYVNSRGDQVIELRDGGKDTVRSEIDYTLGANVENLVLTDRAAIDATGNSLANRLTGNGGDNTLWGLLGRDTLTGGGGDDRFVFSTGLGAGNIDTITDFRAVDDTIVLKKSIFDSIRSFGELDESAFVRNKAGQARDSADRIIYDVDDGRLLYDADGSGRIGAIVFAELGKNLALTNADFFVV